MALTLTYLGDLSRVRLAADSLGASATRAVVERSPDGSVWEAVRGGVRRLVVGGELVMDDYEFLANQPTYYRVTSYDDSDVEQAQFTASITVNLDTVWLKSIRYPMLNTAVRVADFGDVDQVSRVELHSVAGRSLPVGTADIPTGRAWTLELVTRTREEEARVGLVLRVSSLIFLHVPTVGNLSLLPGSMHAAVGSVVQHRIGGVSDWVSWQVPLSAVAPPSPLIVGTTLTWETVRRLWGSWTALRSDVATWQALRDVIGEPIDLEVH